MINFGIQFSVDFYLLLKECLVPTIFYDRPWTYFRGTRPLNVLTWAAQYLLFPSNILMKNDVVVHICIAVERLQPKIPGNK